MTTAQTDNKILRRVRKMLKLAQDSGATEAERDTAMKHVHATLAKYNITLAQAESSEEQEKRGQLREAYLGKPWAIQISAAVARMCFCHYHYHTMGGNKGPTQPAMHVFVGLESNVTTAKEMARFVVESVNTEANRYRRNIGGGYADYRAFAQGAAERIRLRCFKIQDQAERNGVARDDAEDDDAMKAAAKSSMTSLVLSSLYKTEQEANKAWLDERKIELKQGRGQSVDPTRNQSRRAGAEYGDKVSLHRQVGGSSRKQLK